MILIRPLIIDYLINTLMKYNGFYLFLIAMISLSIINQINASINYNPFDSYSNPKINSVYGTGNQLKDISYRAYCAIICNSIVKENTSSSSQQQKILYTDDHCCEGNNVNNISCLSFTQCNRLKSKFQLYVFKITILSYLVISIVSAICSFGFIYWFTKNKVLKLKNAICVSVLIISGAFVIPIMVLYIISKYKGMAMTELFEANFDSLSSFDFIEGVEIKENSRRVVNRQSIQSNRNELNCNSKNSQSKAIVYNEKAELELKTN